MEWLRIIRGSEGLDLTCVQRLSAAEETLADPEVLQKSLGWPPSVLEVMDCSASAFFSFRAHAFTPHPRTILTAVTAQSPYASDVNQDRPQA